MKIGVSGASGQLGAATLGYLKTRAPQAQLVGITRTPGALADKSIEGRFGDYDDAASLEKAYAGLDRLMLIPGMDLRPGARSKQIETAIAAAAKAGVGHVVFLSSLGTRHAEPGEVYESYFGPEQALMRTARTWTILRMAYYADSLIDEARNAFATSGVLASLSSTPVNFVWRDDLAAASAAILTSDGHHGAIYQGTGPASLTGEERAAIIAKAAGKPLGFVQITREQFEGGLKQAGLPEPVVGVVLSIHEAWKIGGFNLTGGDIEQLTGKPPRGLAELAAKAFG